MAAASDNPYKIIKFRQVTEKAQRLRELKDSDSNRSVRRCTQPKYIFVADPRANKQQIATAIEKIYTHQNVKVVKVNTINMKPKPRKVRGKRGYTAAFKKAVVTLEADDTLDNL